MKVLINYEPLKLISVCSKIKQEYKDKYDYENPPSGHLEELLEEISKQGVSSLIEYANLLKDYDVNFLAYHLAKEENIILNTKILRIIQCRISTNVFDIYFHSWQKYYKKLANNLSSRNLIVLSNQGSFLNESIYTPELKSQLLMNNADDVLAISVSKVAVLNKTAVAEVLHNNYNISQTTVLGVNVLKKIYLYCSEMHLIAVSDNDLCNIFNSYLSEEKVRFLINFVNRVNPNHYKKYLKLAELARKIISINSNTFQNLNQNLKIKFQMWYSLIDIDYYFGEDERGVFWKARAIENNAIKVERKSMHDMIIMYFEKFVATEFKITGAIYIVPNDEYENTMRDIIRKSSSTHDLKTRLYHKYNYTNNRIEHRGDWRGNVKYRINQLIR